MLALDDPRWSTLQGGYRVPYDASVALRELETSPTTDRAWDELWNELHHQGDVGEASYAALPHLVRITRERAFSDWNVYAMAATIETSRLSGGNPALPSFIEASYHEAWRQLTEFGLEQLRVVSDELVVRAILGAVAIGKGSVKLGRLISEFDASEIEELYDNFYGAEPVG
jgi:hypothetical protein